jgi:hypothetical protein
MKRKFWIFLVATLVDSILLAACQIQFGIGNKTQPVATPSVIAEPEGSRVEPIASFQIYLANYSTHIRVDRTYYHTFLG